MQLSKSPAWLSCLLVSNNSFVFTFSACYTVEAWHRNILETNQVFPSDGIQKCPWGHVWSLAWVSDSWPSLIQEQRTSPPEMIRGDGNWAWRGMWVTAETEKSTAPGTLNSVGNNSKRFPKDCHLENNAYIPTDRTAATRRALHPMPKYSLVFTGTNSPAWLTFPLCKTYNYFDLKTAEAKYDCFTAIPRSQTNGTKLGKIPSLVQTGDPQGLKWSKWKQNCLIIVLPDLKVNVFNSLSITFLKRAGWKKGGGGRMES